MNIVISIVITVVIDKVVFISLTHSLNTFNNNVYIKTNGYVCSPPKLIVSIGGRECS